MITNGRSLELFFIDGKPDGMLTAEIFNWTGHILVASRTQIKELLRRPESAFTGVYILLGEKDGAPWGYIGEGENIGDRIKNHDAQKDWWSKAILITSSARNLHKAHVKYLESRLIEEAATIGKISLENSRGSAKPNLTESALANMESFLENVLMVLPALRIDAFLQSKRPSSVSKRSSGSDVKVAFELITSKHGIHAFANLMENGEFVVLSKSKARKSWEGKGSENTPYGQLYSELVRTGILTIDGEHRVFSENYAFSSPSAAGAVVNGRPTNGTIEWKVRGRGITYKQWESEQLNELT